MPWRPTKAPSKPVKGARNATHSRHFHYHHSPSRGAIGGGLGPKCTATFLETSEGDPGLARNQGLEAAKGTYAAYLDADDLWSENWLVEAAKLVEQRPDAVAQCACAVAFGDERHLWWHQDSETDLCDPAYLEWMNYWDALVFARRDLLAKYPYHANDLKLGYGHEDWHWNRVTLEAGVPHKPVPRTIHFKRKRCGTQSTLVDKAGGMPWPMA